MNFGKGLTIASLLISLPLNLTKAQISGFNQRAQLPPQLFYEVNTDPNQPQAIPTSTPTAAQPAPCGPHRALSIAWNKNSTLMAVGVGSGAFLCGLAGSLQIFNVSSGNPRLLRTIHATNWIKSVTFSPDGTQLVTGGDDDEVNVYEGVSPFNHLQTLTEAGSDVNTVAFNSNGTLLAAGGEDSEVRLYIKNVRNLFTLVKTLSDARGYIKGVDFHPINGQLAVAEERSRLRVYSGISPYNRLENLFVSGSFLLAVAYNSDGTLLACADIKQTIRLYNGTNPDENRPLQTLMLPQRIESIVFNQEGAQLLIGYVNGGVDVYGELKSSPRVAIIPIATPISPASALAFSPDGKWLSIGRLNRVLMYRIDGVRLPTAQASTTEAITTAVAATAVNTTAVNTTAVNTTAVNTTDASTGTTTEMDNSSTLKALSLIVLLTAVLQDIVLQ